MYTELCTGESTEMGTEGGDKCVDNVDKLRKKEWRKGTNPEEVRNTTGRQRGQGNFELITNSDYVHEGRLTLAKVCVGAGSQSLP